MVRTCVDMVVIREVRRERRMEGGGMLVGGRAGTLEGVGLGGFVGGFE